MSAIAIASAVAASKCMWFKSRMQLSVVVACAAFTLRQSIVQHIIMWQRELCAQRDQKWHLRDLAADNTISEDTPSPLHHAVDHCTVYFHFHF